jgi:phospholipase/carboxylesterase
MAGRPADRDMDERVLEELVGLLGPLLRGLELLGMVSRHFHPPQFADLACAIAGADVALLNARSRLTPWPEGFGHVRGPLESAADEALAAFDGLGAALDEGDLRQGFRALRRLSLAQEALYRLASLPPVSRYFVEPSRRADGDLLTRLAAAGAPAGTGVLHFDNEADQRGGFSIYVPEYYDEARTWPVAVALHGGSGHGRSFLWSWLRDVRSQGTILVAPTSAGPTWALSGPDLDTPNLDRILAAVGGRWRIDASRLLLTGMSDGGTFAYVTGLEGRSPFTHLAPVAASFHPMLAEFADRERLRNLPIRIVHGALDWMFPIDVARQAFQALSIAGADVSLTELADLSHTYPQEQNLGLLEWLAAERS